MTAVACARGTMGTAAACEALGVARATVYRRRAPARPPAPRPTPPRALAPVERQRVLETLDSERFLDQAPAQVHATRLDEGTYLCSPVCFRQACAALDQMSPENHPAAVGGVVASAF